MTQHWGGKRSGAGRPKHSGKWGEPTQAIRLPISQIQALLAGGESLRMKRPLYGTKVSAGFPSPADDYLESHLDLNEYLIPHPSTTFFVRATGDSMINAGIFPNDILVVDRSLEPVHGKIVIALVNGELTVKRLVKLDDHIQLKSENASYPPINFSTEDELIIWGIVTSVIHPV